MVDPVDTIFIDEETAVCLKSHSSLQNWGSISSPQTPHCARGTGHLNEEEMLKRKRRLTGDAKMENLTHLPSYPELALLPAPYVSSRALWILQGVAGTSEAAMSCIEQDDLW